ncbi:hypothetical protein GCM10010246_05550 [Streptomyces cuspidosporus]|uniref:Amidohydrolase-related domain-containing protein n=1 Tax=Streptomyces cuspidosporus TaxID=66882 RepID=A0ABN3FBQ5_9ACTN
MCSVTGTLAGEDIAGHGCTDVTGQAEAGGNRRAPLTGVRRAGRGLPPARPEGPTMTSTDRWLIGFRYQDLPGRIVRCFYLVDAADPRRAQQIAAARAHTPVEISLSSSSMDRVGEAVRRGVKVALGTDAGAVQHARNLRELGHLVELGMSPLEAIRAGTLNAAQMMGLDETLGTIEPGKTADPKRLVATGGERVPPPVATRAHEALTAARRCGPMCPGRRRAPVAPPRVPCPPR